MLRQSEWFRPQPGERVINSYDDSHLGVVIRTEGNICYFVSNETGRSSSYIWRFQAYVYPYERKNKILDCLNKLVYTWPDATYREIPKIEDCYA